MKCPLFYSNAWSVAGSMERVPGRVQKHGIKVGNKNMRHGGNWWEWLRVVQSSVVVHEQVPALVFVLIYVCVCTCEHVKQRLSCSSWPGVGRCLWKASQKRKLSHVNISTIS